MSIKIQICNWKNCSQKWNKYIIKRLESDKNFYNYKEEINIEQTTCMWNCKNSINIKIDKEMFSNQNPAETSKIIRNKILKSENNKNLENLE